MRFVVIFFKLLLVSLFALWAYYIIEIETEKYESGTIIMIKDLSSKQSVSALGEMLLPTGNESTKDAKLLELYLKSSATYNLLDKDFNLSGYYSSDKIDYVHRLRDKTPIPTLQKNRMNLLAKYNSDLTIIYDKISTTIELRFAHADAKIAKQIVERLTKYANDALNRFDKKNTKVILDFLQKQERKKYQVFLDSLQKLLKYQNKHNTIDPKIDVESKSKILAGLESQLVQKEVEYNGKQQYLNLNSPEMQILQGNMDYIRDSISSIKNRMAGDQYIEELNVNVSDFELLKSEVAFNKELYKQTLIKLEETVVMVGQQSKNLIVISGAGVAENYKYPNKIKDVLSLFIVFVLLYGIISMIFSIIRDHKD